MPPTYHATFTSDARSAVLARMAISRFAGLCGFSHEEQADIATAVGEALITSAQYRGGFGVTCTFDEGELRIEIQSSGNAGEGSTGFGTIIMRKLMNEISYSRGGTRVRLIKRKEL